MIGQPSSLPIPPDSDQQSRFVSNRLQVIPPTARSFVHSFPVSRTLPWTFVLMKSQGGQVSRWSSVKDWFRDIGSTGSPKKGLHNVLGHEPLVFSLTVNLSENGLLTTCCFGYLTTDYPRILMTLALTVT